MTRPLAILVACWTMPLAAASPQIEYNRDVRPILSDKCFRCHGPDAAKREAELRLDRRDEAIANRDSATPIVPGEPEASEAYRRITSGDADERMPPFDSNVQLTQEEIETLRRWIEAGAEYQPHWAFIPPQPAPLPKVEQADWPKNPIDHFVLAELEQSGLKPSPEAAPETLCRRLYLDLTGIPPTSTEVEAFVRQHDEKAYSALVDKLLASPRYGERMALDWLDAARYADTNGYYTDAERQSWPWRDWVIRAFNANLPFDEFTIEQLAGDLLPEATLDQRIATGFNRNHMVTSETGIIDEEYRVGYVVDRVDTTTTVWLGLSVGCARCHDHKYDPISQRDYYGVFACFNNVAETGLVKEVTPSNAPPVVSLPTKDQERRLAELREEQTACETRLKAAKPALNRELAAWEKTAVETLPQLPTEGCVAHFPFDDDVKDHGPRGLAATVVGKLPLGTGVHGRSATLDATQYVEFDEPQPLDGTKPFTLSIWIMPGGSPQGCVVSKMDADATSRGFEIMWYKSQPRVSLVHKWGRDALEVVAKQKFGTKQWHLLTIAYNGRGRAEGLQLYVDGQPAEVDVRRDNLSGTIACESPWQIGWKATGVGFEGNIDEFRLYDRPLSADEVDALYWRDLLEGVIALPPAERDRRLVERLEAYYIERHGDDELRKLVAETADVKRREEEMARTILATSVMQEMDKPRETHLLMRGQYDQPGEVVHPSVPAALGSLPADAPSDRLGLARWLVDKNNPLTARVTVNRLWQMCFGEGLVRTVNDFGVQGEPPTHPELLDWLAVRFQEGARRQALVASQDSALAPSAQRLASAAPWDIKALLKLIVTSAAYRQSSDFTKPLLARDPTNRLLARGPRYRLGAEAIRDQALAVGGLLVERIGGPSVKPYQPPGIWEAVSYNGEQSYEADTGEGLYRRSLYTFWKRQAPPPGLLAFDGPTREICTVRRARTNTPLQALVLLNDVTYVEAARGLATRMLRDGGNDDDSRVRYGFKIATGRKPNNVEIAALTKFYEAQLADFRGRPQAAKAYLHTGETKPDASLDPCELAAWAMTAGVLLNLDEVVTQH